MNFIKTFAFLLAMFLSPINSVGEEVSALGFVEDPKAYEHDGYYIRLAFIRTDKGWSPSCDFSEGEDASVIFKNVKSCTHKIMKQSWQVINANGKRVDAGTLKFMHRTWREIGLAKSSRSLENKIQFDSLNLSLETWKENGKRMLPLLAVPLGTNIEKLEPVAMNSSAEKK